MSFRNSAIPKNWSNEVIFKFSNSKFRNFGISERLFWDSIFHYSGNPEILEYFNIPIFRYYRIPEYRNIGIFWKSGKYECRNILIFQYSDIPILHNSIILEYWNNKTNFWFLLLQTSPHWKPIFCQKSYNQYRYFLSKKMPKGSANGNTPSLHFVNYFAPIEDNH